MDRGSIVFFSDLKICLRMVAYRTFFGSVGAHHDMSAITAFPNRHTALLEHGLIFHVVQKGTVALLMRLLDGCDSTELGSQLVEALLVRLSCHTVIHIGPLGVLSLRSMQQILCRIAQLSKCLEPKLGAEEQ